MFRKLTLAIPLIVATAAAQEVSTDNWNAEAYGDELVGQPQMDLKYLVTPDEQLHITGGESGMPVVIVANLERAETDLSPFGLKGWLLVDNPIVIGAATLGEEGEVSAPLDHITGAGYDFKSIFTQAVSIANDAPTFSNGMRFTFKTQPQAKSTAVNTGDEDDPAKKVDPADERKARLAQTQSKG